MRVHVFDTMGTTASLRIPNVRGSAAVAASVNSLFREFDLRFSLYREDSEISQIARSELSLLNASGILRDTYAESLEWRRCTGGSFTPHRPDGVLDLSGIVKAKAMDAAAPFLDAASEEGWLLNVGGDILANGTRDGRPWLVSVVDPDDRGALLCTARLAGNRRALATSGTAERGEHIWRIAPETSSPTYRQVTVLADDIVTADVMATAILAAGPRASDELFDNFDIDVLAVDYQGHLVATPGMQTASGLVPDEPQT